MISVTKLRNGAVFEYHDEPWKVLDYKHVHLSRGSGTITVKAKNLLNATVQSHTFRSGDRVQEAQVERRHLLFLYFSDEGAVLMDSKTFEQITLKDSMVAGLRGFLTSDRGVAVLYWNEQPMGIELPAKVTLNVQQASPGVKGDTVAGASKDAILETGLRVRVPLFIEEGDAIVVDTRSGEYVERAKE